MKMLTNGKPRILDLFAGGGGFSLGLHRAGFETAAFCEYGSFPQKVLAKNFPGVPIFSDIRTLSKEKLLEHGIDNIFAITGGFPCQPFSIAGKKRSDKDDRDLWPEMFRVIGEVRPTWVIGENVPNFVNLAFTRTKTNLESIGYTVRTFAIPACGVGARHKRERIWIVAHLDGPGVWQQSIAKRRCSGEGQSSIDGEEEFIADAYCDGFPRTAVAGSKEDDKRKRQSDGWTEAAFDFSYRWADQSGMGGGIHGVSHELDPYRSERVATLGNSIDPAIAEIIGRYILEFEKQRPWLNQ